MKKYFSYILASICLLSVAGSACREDDLGFNHGAENPLAGGLKVMANISHPEVTRAYIASGPVNSGKFTIAYPYTYAWVSGDGYGHNYYFYYHYGEVNFGFAGEETTGFINIGTATAPKELIWSPSNSSANEGIIYYPNKSTASPLFLDNMPYLTTNATVQRDTIYNLADFPNLPFKAGVFDAVNGTNDLLWGTTSVLSGEDYVEFDLYHRMTRLNITVNVDNSNEQGYKTTLKNAQVYLENVLVEPQSYLRKYGELRFEKKVNGFLEPEIDESLYTDFTLVEGNLDAYKEGAGPSPEPDDAPAAWDALTWASDQNDIFQTKDFVFVPQTLRQGATTRPRLVIKVPSQDVNSGINDPAYGDYIYFSANLPYTMRMMDESGNESVMTLDFLKGYNISLTTKLTPGEPELLFAPVTVEPWVWKGTFGPESRQSGVFNPDDFYNLITTYNENNSFWLGKYGFISSANQASGTWTFQFNSGELKLEIDKIMGMMHPNQPVNGPNGETSTPPFAFDFRNRNQNYVMPNGEIVPMGQYASSQNLLYSIVTSQRNVGVNGQTGFTFDDLVSDYQNRSWEQFLFGSYTYTNPAVVPGPGTWNFKITDDITLEYSDIIAQMIPDAPNYFDNFQFVIEPGVTVTVENYPGNSGQPTNLEVTSANHTALYNIVTQRMPGVYSSEQFNNLMTYYNGDLDLSLFLKEGSAPAVFPLWRDLIMYSQSIQGGMKAKPANPYSFDFQGRTVDLRQFDGTAYTATTPSELYMLVNLNKMTGIEDNEAFLEMINTYNSNDGAAVPISTYGYYCFNPARWIFFLQGPITLKRSEIEGIMPVTDGKLQYSFDFNKNGVYLMEDDGEAYELLSGTEGQNKLVEILSGSN